MGDLRTAIQTLHASCRKLARLRGRAEPVLGRPATKAALARLEQQIGTLPPLVRELLAAANGWTHVPISEPDVTWFSCAELASPAYAAFVAKVRATRGFMRERNVQAGFVIGGHDDAAVVVTPDATPQIVIYGLRPRTQGMSGPPSRFFALWTQAIEDEVGRVAERKARSTDPLARVDEGIAAFNYPGEMGDDVHDSVEQLSEIVDELAADSPFAPALRRLLAELERGYTGAMRFGAARRRKQRIEILLDRAWVPLDKAPAP